MNNGVKWVKIYTDMISNKKIKRIRKMPEGNNIVLVWVFLIIEAGNTNKNGALFLTDTMPFNPDDLAIEFDFDVGIIKLALKVLESFGMIEVFDDILYIKNWNQYQNVDGLDKIREQNKIRVARFRQKQKSLMESNVTGDITVMHGNAIEIDKELELDKELDKDKDLKERAIVAQKHGDVIKSIIEHLNFKANTNFKHSTKTTHVHINARLAEGFVYDDFIKVIDVKCDEWLSDAKMRPFLRPQTLFGTKFESYLNQNPVKKFSFLDVEVPNDF